MLDAVRVHPGIQPVQTSLLLKSEILRSGPLAEGRHDLSDQCSHVVPLHRERQVALIEPSKVVQLVHEPLHPARLVSGPLQPGPQRVGNGIPPGLRQCVVQGPEDEGQGRPKLVGQVGKKAALRPLQPGDLLVERLRPPPRPVPVMTHRVEQRRYAR